MPISIIDHTNSENGEKGIRIEWLCDDEWEMPVQIKSLDQWLTNTGCKLPAGTYTADLGFSPRAGALGGGAVLTTKSMRIMVEIGMNLYLSEYPEFVEQEPET